MLHNRVSANQVVGADVGTFWDWVTRLVSIDSWLIEYVDEYGHRPEWGSRSQLRA